MKRTFRILSYIGLAVATTIAIVLFSQGIPLPSSGAGPVLAKAFDDFPVDQSQFIDFRVDEPTIKKLSDREQKDQLRDWLLFTIASDSSLSAEEINESLYDVSTSRQGYMRPVSNFEYGTTRSLYVGDGEVVALIPEDLSVSEQIDALAHIVDKQRKDLGQKPTYLVVFEYTLKPAEHYAWLTRRDVINAATLFTDSVGYTESEITSLKDFQTFIDKVDDLTYVRLANSKLVVGGRKLQSRDYGKIRVEDVAAIWQSEDKIRRDFTAFEAKWNTKLNQAPPSQREQIEQEAYQEIAELGLVNGSGFSLDPKYDYDSLNVVFEKSESAIKKLGLNGRRIISDQEIEGVRKGLNTNPKTHNIVPLLKVLQKLETLPSEAFYNHLSWAEENTIYELLDAKSTYQLQAARYDGNLQGTEVGMVLFYTDLLAKLWALNYENSIPSDQVPDFAPLTEISSAVSSIYKKELEELSNTRVWFGAQDKGFQSSDRDNSLIFARNATRVYSASSSPFQPGDEVFAAADSDAFLGWWNDHYEEIAAYEPQYERLNAIMKWSLVISWLNNSGKGNRLNFLQAIEVQRDFWFPDWAEAQRENLQFQDWKRIQFYPKGYLNIETETMPLLRSKEFERFGQTRYKIGGISLANEELFKARKPLSSSINGLNQKSYRSNINYDSITPKVGQSTFKTLDGTAYRFFQDQPDLFSVAAKAKDGNKLRASQSELANLEFVRDVSRTDEGLKIDTSFAGKSLGQLNTTNTGNGFTVGWRSRSVDEGIGLAQKINDSPDIAITDLFEQDPIVAQAAQIKASGTYLVKVQGADDWMQISGGGGGNKIPPGWQARVGSSPDAPNNSSFGLPPRSPGPPGPPITPKSGDDLLLLWIDDDLIAKEINKGSVVLLVNKLNEPSTSSANDFIPLLKQGDYQTVAQNIVDDPNKVKAVTHDHLLAGLKVIDDLRQQKRIPSALDELDNLIKVHGREPELMLRKGLLEMDRERLTAKPLDFNPALDDVVQEQARFYDEVNQILDDPNDGFHTVVTDDQALYIHDGTGFNNQDPASAIDDPLPFGSEARVYRVESGGIGTAHVSNGGYEDPITPRVKRDGPDGPRNPNGPRNFKLNNYYGNNGQAVGELGFCAVEKGYRLKLVAVDQLADVPSQGKRLLVVASVGQGYHIRVFDHEGQVVIDKNQDQLKLDASLTQKLEEAFTDPLKAETNGDLRQAILTYLNYKEDEECPLSVYVVIRM